MVLKRESVSGRLEELDRILSELLLYESVMVDDLLDDLSQRWIIERGLIAAAGIILDIAEHILVAHFGAYSNTYEASLAGIHERGVVSDTTYQQLKGLGGFRNILVHLYQDVDITQLWQNYRKALSVFPQFVREVTVWLDRVDL